MTPINFFLILRKDWLTYVLHVQDSWFSIWSQQIFIFHFFLWKSTFKTLIICPWSSISKIIQYSLSIQNDWLSIDSYFAFIVTKNLYSDFFPAWLLLMILSLAMIECFCILVKKKNKLTFYCNTYFSSSCFWFFFKFITVTKIIMQSDIPASHFWFI